MRIGIAVVVLLAILVAAGAYWARPLIALGQLKSAIQARDEAAVARRVDFDKLENNVVHHLDQRIEQKNQDKFLGKLRGEIESFVTGFVVEDLATPSGLIHLSCDTDAQGNIDRSPKPPGTPCEFDADIQSANYESRTRFNVVAHRPQRGEIGMVMEQGADRQWRLVSLTGSGPLSE